MTEIQTYLASFAEADVQKVVFSEKAAKDGVYKKAVIRKIAPDKYQTERFTQTQVFHENFPSEGLTAAMEAMFPAEFCRIEIFTATHIHAGRVTSKGKLLTNRRKNDEPVKETEGNDRKKHYLLDADHLPPVFEDIGILTHDGKIRREKYDKYKQICRFTELIDDVLSHDKRETLHIVDFGCGKSYLTFVLYYYITEILHKKASITGLDLKEDVIRNCQMLAEKYRYDGLEFLCMDVKDYIAKADVDMVIALHACDIATDYALYFALKAGADYIFSVPCCHKEARRQIKGGTLDSLTDYGVVCDALSSAVTDVIRAKTLEVNGYRTEVLEFVELENTPKNRLIRAVRSKKADKIAVGRAKTQIERLKEQFSVSLTLERLLDGRE